MVKKALFLLVMAVGFVGVVFAQEAGKPSKISVGVKATIDASSDDNVQTGPYRSGSYAVEGTTSEIQCGFSVFLDVRFVEFSANFLIGADTFQINKILGVNVNLQPGAAVSFLAGFSLLGKFPFNVWKLTLAPALGVEYRFMVMRDELDLGYDPVLEAITPYNSFLLKCGGIVDVDLTDNLYLRGNLLFGINAAMFTNGNPYMAGIFTQFQLGIGYRL